MPTQPAISCRHLLGPWDRCSPTEREWRPCVTPSRPLPWLEAPEHSPRAASNQGGATLPESRYHCHGSEQSCPPVSRSHPELSMIKKYASVVLEPQRTWGLSGAAAGVTLMNWTTAQHLTVVPHGETPSMSRLYPRPPLPSVQFSDHPTSIWATHCCIASLQATAIEDVHLPAQRSIPVLTSRHPSAARHHVGRSPLCHWALQCCPGYYLAGFACTVSLAGSSTS